MPEPGRVGKRFYRLLTRIGHNRWANKKTFADPTRLHEYQGIPIVTAALALQIIDQT